MYSGGVAFRTRGPLIFSRSDLVRVTDAVVATIDAIISRQKARCYSECAIAMHSVPHTLIRDLPNYAACFLANAATSACVANQQSPFALAWRISSSRIQILDLADITWGCKVSWKIAPAS